VASKHVLVFAVFVVCCALYIVLAVICGAAGYDRIPMLDFESAMIGLFIINIYNAVILALSYKFGAQSTRYVALAIFFVIFFLNSWLSSAGISLNFDFFASLNGNITGILLLAGAVIVNVVSFLISYPIYAKKDF
jgi:hypothetical protein